MALANFQRISFDEANPSLVGAERGQKYMTNAMNLPLDIKRKMLANQIAQVQAQYAQPNAQQNLLSQQLNNQKIQELMPYLAPKEKAALQKMQLGNEMTQKKLPYAETQALADAMSKLMYSQYMGSPGLAQKYLTPEGKTYTEPGVVRQVQGQIQNNPLTNVLDIMRQTGSPVPSSLQQMSNNQQQPQASMQQAESDNTQSNNAMNSNKSVNNMSQQAGINESNSSIPMTPQQQINEEYNLQRLKNISDPMARQKALYALNIDKSLGFIDPKDLLAYSGPKGAIQKKLDQGMDALGNPSVRYQKYTKAVDAAGFLAQQVRQFYGASIRPEMTKKLEKLTNPEEWYRSPETAKRIFDQTKSILQNELKTYRDAFSLRSVYSNPTDSSLTPTQNNEKSYEKISVISPDGKRGTVPANKLEMFLKNGYKQG